MSQRRRSQIRSGRAHSLAPALVLALGCATGQVTSQSSATGLHVTPASLHSPSLIKGIPFSSPELGFELDKPPGGSWAIATNVTSPEGRPIPVVVAHPQSGAQIVIQVSEPVDSPRKLAAMLREKLRGEQTLQLGTAQKLQMDSGSDAYGFEFAVRGEAKGRVAVISVGDEIVLVVASWPENADPHIVQDIDGVVRSVRTPTGASHASLRPDRA